MVKIYLVKRKKKRGISNGFKESVEKHREKFFALKKKSKSVCLLKRTFVSSKKVVICINH